MQMRLLIVLVMLTGCELSAHYERNSDSKVESSCRAILVEGITCVYCKYTYYSSAVSCNWNKE